MNKDEIISIIEWLVFWTEGSLECEQHIWDSLQRECAEECVKEAKSVIQYLKEGQ